MPISVPLARAAAAVLGLALFASGCGSEPPEAQLQPAAGGTQRQASDSLATLEPRGPFLPARAQIDPEVTNGTRLRFTRTLTPDQRAMVESHLADAIEISGGAGADVRVANPDLNADGRNDAIVMIHSGPYCGSGNVCNLWIFENTGDGWHQINNGHEDAAAEVYLMPDATNGYRNIGLRGLCATETCDFLLAFDGERYRWVNDPKSPPPRVSAD